ncbi:toxin-activating lysine-acyltransferase [Rhizobium sp.]|uniref:toxin-activating lysine-acyltransferase n=1 Tax=Rhizobium sp. TaxID=391 RepID=UPI003F7E3FF5
MADDHNAADQQTVKGTRNDTATRLRAVRTLLHSTVGQVVLAMSAAPRYRYQALSDISHLVVDPLIRDKIAIAHASAADDEQEAALSPAAVAIWASVSEEVDRKIREQIQAKAFPVRLRSDDWNSGNIVWLLDVVAPSREMATSVLSNFSKVAKSDTVKIHPMITQLVDAEVLSKLIVKPGSDDVVASKLN